MHNKKNGLLVLDDELVPSHATDVELKTVSNCKSGKEGPVSSCISDSQIGTLFAMRLRTKGVSCEENCKVMETIPRNTLAESKLCMTFNRGYGKMKFVQMMMEKGFDILTIASWFASPIH